MFYVPLSLVTAWGMALLARRPEQALTLAVALLALAVPDRSRGTPVSGRPAEVVPGLDARGRLLLRLLPFLTSGWLLRQPRRRPYLRAPARLCVPALLIAAVLLGLPQGMNWQRGLWTERYDEAEGRSRYGSFERDSFYLQPKLLERELAALKPGRKGLSTFISSASPGTRAKTCS